MFLFLLYFGIAFALHLPQALVVFKDTVLTDVDFYEKHLKDDWDSFDLKKKQKNFNAFLKNELAYYDALKKGVHLNPKTTSSLNIRKKQILLNNFYEHAIARPLADTLEVEANIKNLQYKAEAYHLLIGYKGSLKNTESTISQSVARNLIDSLCLVIKLADGNNNIEEVFMDLAFIYSIDPSAKQNRGFLGWVPWGKTVMSFQAPLFSLPELVLSEPVHTEYGYHLILKKSTAFSNTFYYGEENYLDLAFKLAESSLPFDSLRSLSSSFDSLTIQNTGVRFSSVAVDSLVSFLLIKQRLGRLVGNKNQLIDWLKTNKNKKTLFVFNKKGFGAGWLIEKLKGATSSRIPPIKTKRDLKDLVLFFILEEEVLALANEKEIWLTSSFKKDWLNNKKNIIYNAYLSSLLNALVPLDSVLVKNEYNKQTLENRLLRPKRVVFSEIRVFDLLVAQEVFARLASGESFDNLLVEFGGNIREPISITKKTPLALALFETAPGELSDIVTNNNGSFSLARVERVLKEEMFTLDLVYKKIERELVSAAQDSIKLFLLEDLIRGLDPKINFSVLGL